MDKYPYNHRKKQQSSVNVPNEQLFCCLNCIFPLLFKIWIRRQTHAFQRATVWSITVIKTAKTLIKTAKTSVKHTDQIHVVHTTV